MLKNTFYFGAALLALSTLLNGCYTHQGINQIAATSTATNLIAQTIENIVYTPEEWSESLRADLYLPQKQGPHPVVLVIHGGGWAARSREDMNSTSKNLARHGYAVFNVSYRFAPAFTYPAQIHDLQQALRWLAKNADTYDLDSTRINTWGYSSGAHLAALLGSIDSIESPSSEQNELPKIKAVVAGGIPSDLRKYSGSPIVVPFLGGDRHELPEIYAQASPVFHISVDDPPVFLYHGKLDSLVTVDQASDYYLALRAAGIKAELYLHNWFGHATMFLFGGDAEEKAIDFLDRNNS